MKVSDSGRFTHPAASRIARRYAEEHLASVHGRLGRLNAIARGARLRSNERTLDSMDAATRIACAHPVAQRADWLLLRDYEGSGRGRSVLFFFTEDDLRPSAVMKVRSIEAGGQSLRREADVLRVLASTLDRGMLGTIPHVQDFSVAAGHELLVLSGLAGRALSVLMQRSLRPRASHATHLIRAGAWLGRLHAATRCGAQVSVHGDFWPRNILFDSGVVSGVVDWEHGSSAGEPWLDLFTLPLLFATEAPAWRKRDRERAFRNAFVNDSPLSGAIAAYFRSWSRVTGVELRDLRDEFDRYLAHHERKEETGWHKRYPWAAMRAAMQSSNRSVFSG